MHLPACPVLCALSDPYSGSEKRYELSPVCVHRRGATPSSMSSSSTRPVAAARAPAASTVRRAPAASTSAVGGGAATRRPVGSATGARVAPTKPAPNAAAIQELTREMSEMRVSVEALEKERDFYFGKVSFDVILCQSFQSSQNEPLTDCFVTVRRCVITVYKATRN